MFKQTNKKRVLFVRTLRPLVLGLFVCLGIFIAVQAPIATAATADTINFQARLLSGAGNIAPDGNYNVEFKLYNAETGGTAVWTETRTGANRVRVANGYLSAALGSVTSFPTNMDWNQSLWLTMNIGGSSPVASWDGEMDPRLRLTAVPYAMSAANAVRASAADMLQNTDFNSTLGWVPQTAQRSILLPDASGTVCLAGSDECGFLKDGGNVANATMRIGTTTNFGTDFIVNNTTIMSLTGAGVAVTGDVSSTGNNNVGGNLNVTGNVNVAGTFTADKTLFKNGVDSTNAFDIQNSGGKSLLTVDTVNNRVTIVGMNVLGATAWDDGMTKLADPASMPGTNVFSTAWSPDGQYFSVGSQTSGTGRLTIYKRSGDVLTKLNDPVIMPGSFVYSTSWSPDTQYLTVGSSSSSGANLTIYKRSGDTFSKLANPASMPGGEVRSAAWSPDGQYVTVGSNVATVDRFTIYKRSGDTFTKLADPAAMPGSNVRSIAWSPDGQYITVGSAVSDATRFTIYKRSGDTFTKLADPAAMPGNTVYTTAWSPDGQYISVGSLTTGADRLTIYKANNLTTSTVINGSLNVNGRASGMAAVNDNEFTTLGQLRGAVNGVAYLAGDSQTFSGSGTTFRNANNTTNAFAVQTANGTSLLSINTQGSIINVGSSSTWDMGIAKLPDPVTLPSASLNVSAWSPDGQYLSVGLAATSTDRFSIYKRSGDSFTRLSNPASLPTLNVAVMDWSSDGQYLAVGSASATSNRFLIYKRSGDTFTKLADPADMPVGSIQSASWSPDMQYLTVGTASAPYMIIYKRSGDTFTKLADPAAMPSSTMRSASWTPDGQYLSVASASAPYMIIYKRSGDTFTKLADPAVLPAGTTYSTIFSPDGQYLSVGSLTSNTDRLIIYKRSGDTFTKLADPAVLPGNQVRSTSWTPDGQYLSVGSNNAPYITVYKRSGDIFTKVSDPESMPGGDVRSVVFSPDGQYLSVGASSSPYLYIYKPSAVESVTNIHGLLTVFGRASGQDAIAANEFTTLGQVQTMLTNMGTGDLLHNGNSFGETLVIGTNDNYGVNFEVNNTTVLGLTTSGANVTGELSTTGDANIGGALNVTGDVNVSGTFTGNNVLFRNTANSTTAFDIQNAGGLSLFTVDTLNNKVNIVGMNLNVDNDGKHGAWTTSSNPLPTARSYAASTTANGYVYVIGGVNSGYADQSTVYYAKFNPDGSTSAWTTSSNPLPTARQDATAVTASNGYIYVMGGSSTNTVYYAKVNPDGSTSAWTTSSNPLPVILSGAASTTANGYIYVMGGYVTGNVNTVYYAKVNPDGSTSAWTTSSNPLPTAMYGPRATIYNGYVYVASGGTNNVYYAKLNANGTTDPWVTNANPLPASRSYSSMSVANGYLYIMGGSSSTTVYYAKINTNGSTAAWTTSTDPIPAVRDFATSVTANGYVYVVGGNGGGMHATVYYAALQRTVIGGTTEFRGTVIGQDAQNVNEFTTLGQVQTMLGNVGTYGILQGGNSFGQAITIGTNDNYGVNFEVNNTTVMGLNSTGASVNGNLSTTGNASIGGNVSIAGDVNVSGTFTGNNVLFRNTANSTTAFNIQNAGGLSLFTVDTLNNKVNIVGMSLNVQNDGSIGTWRTTTALPVPSLSQLGAVEVNGYVYILGGINNTGTVQSAVRYAKVHTNGNIDSWSGLIAPLPAARYGASVVTANGYIYVIGGYNASHVAQSTMYYAKVASDGMISSWTTASIPHAMANGDAVVYNNYVYFKANQLPNTNFYYAALNPNTGAAGVWGSAGDYSEDQGYRMAALNNTLYFMGGIGSSAVKYAQIYSDGSLSSFILTNDLPEVKESPVVVTANGYIYVVGGSNGGSYTSSAYYAKPTVDGEIDEWLPASNSLPLARGNAGGMASNGNIYVIGGESANTTYVAPLQKTIIGGTTEFQGAVIGQDAVNGNEFTTLGQVQAMLGNVGTSGILQGGNSFGTAMTIGTNDAYGVNFRVGGSTALSLGVGGTVMIGSNVTFNGTTGEMSFTGNAQHTRRITLNAEYSGAILDAVGDATCSSANSGTLVSGYDVTNRINYYNWSSTQGSAQCYNVVVQVPLPSDFAGWASTTPVRVQTHTSNTTNGTARLELRDSNNNVIYNYVAITPGSNNTWATVVPSGNINTGATYTAGDSITLRLRVSSQTSANLRIGTITLDYKSKW